MALLLLLNLLTSSLHRGQCVYWVIHKQVVYIDCVYRNKPVGNITKSVLRYVLKRRWKKNRDKQWRRRQMIQNWTGWLRKSARTSKKRWKCINQNILLTILWYLLHLFQNQCNNYNCRGECGRSWRDDNSSTGNGNCITDSVTGDTIVIVKVGQRCSLITQLGCFR